MNLISPRLLLACVAIGLTSGCVTATVDEMTFNEPVEGIGDSSVVILGRRHLGRGVGGPGVAGHGPQPRHATVVDRQKELAGGRHNVWAPC